MLRGVDILNPGEFGFMQENDVVLKGGDGEKADEDSKRPDDDGQGAEKRLQHIGS